MTTPATEHETALQSTALAPTVPVPASALPQASPFNRLDEKDMQSATALGLLLPDLPVTTDALVPDFGVAYDKKGGNRITGCCTDVFTSQRALQERCKEFAMQRGFQLVVSSSSTRPNGGGNVKYRCKKLHGQQFFDATTPARDLQCPFYINGYGKNQQWKITRACFLHNHYKFIGSRVAPPVLPSPIQVTATTSATSDTAQHRLEVPSGVLLSMNAGRQVGEQQQQEEQGNGPLLRSTKHEVLAAGAGAGTEAGCGVSATAIGVGGEGGSVTSSPSERIKSQRNTTMSMKTLCRLVLDEVNKYPTSDVMQAKLDGKMIRRILLGQGHTINNMMSSRIKRQFQEDRLTNVRISFQKLCGYFNVVAQKNPGSQHCVEQKDDGTFTRALFISSATLTAVKYCRKIVSLDHVTYSHKPPKILSGQLGKLGSGENDDMICGVYLKASTKDFNDKVITFALALVTEENQLNWEWFLHALQDTEAVDWNEYTVIAGRTRGLQTAIQTAWPRASHHYCMRRVVEDELMMGKNIPMTRDQKQRIFDLARSESETDYDAMRKTLVRTNEAAVAYLDKFDRKHWVKYAFLEAFRRPTFNELTSDLSTVCGSDELFSQYASASHIAWFGEDPICSSQPLYTFNQYFMKIAEIFHQRRESVKARPVHELVPLRDAQLQQILQGSQRCESIPCASKLYMVRCLGPTPSKTPDSWRHVNLADWECTCQAWQDQQFPCLHAIHAAELEQLRIDSLYHAKQNSIENYLSCYATSFTPWPVDASPIQIEVSMKSPLDFYFSADGFGRRKKPGPRPKLAKNS
uniref:SWIM-type domain-containing protein n=1 Tax=Peronospora matthiolae TaxID=2874970 RepID=A0AAV1TK64_9STRA